MIQRALICAAVALTCLCLAGGCLKSPTVKKPQPVVRDVPPVLRGTVGSESTFKGIEPVLVSGYGFVVGLNGTGGKPLRDDVAATMEREMGLKGIGKATDAPGTMIDGRTPRQMLRDPNTAVVLVQAAIPPGAPSGSEFDVYVQALNASSLEGGTLWTTELRVGDAVSFGGPRTRTLAEANGPIFINPLTDPDKGSDIIAQDRGRVLNGGRVTNPVPIRIILDNASHQRAQGIVSAINSRFPIGPGDPLPTALGRGGPKETGPGIDLRVPRRFSKESADFIRIVQHLPINQDFPEEQSQRYVAAMQSQPELADDLSWCLVAVGEKCLPFVRKLYEYAEPLPRMAALRAGARLGDPRVAGHLRELASNGIGAEQTEAISLLANLSAGPTIDVTLRSLLESDELLIRVAAYEALAKRAERDAIARDVIANASTRDPTAAPISLSRAETLAIRNLPAGTIHGVERRFVHGKFFVDVVPFGSPLIYVTQQGTPRIVLFGKDVMLRRPLLASAWSDRLMLTSDSPTDPVRVFYRGARGERAVAQSVPADILGLIEYFAKPATPEDPLPGLDFTYSEVVGALSAIQESGGTAAAWATEENKLKAAIYAAKDSRTIRERPETPDDAQDTTIRKPKLVGDEFSPKPEKAQKPTIEPIVPQRGSKAAPK